MVGANANLMTAKFSSTNTVLIPDEFEIQLAYHVVMSLHAALFLAFVCMERLRES
jgi:hypothetical protein